MSRRLAVIAALLLVPSISAAQPGLTNPQEPDDEQPANRTPPVPPTYVQPTYVQPTYRYEAPMPYSYPAPMLQEQKSEGVATALSIGMPTVGLMMLGSGASRGEGGMVTAGLLTLVIGPSAGHIYAGETGHAVKMSLLRGASFVTFMVGAARLSSAHTVGAPPECVDCLPQPQRTNDNHDNGGTLMWVGGLTFVAATIYDVIDSSRAARRTNIKSARAYTVVPGYAQTNSGAVPMVALGGSF